MARALAWCAQGGITRFGGDPDNIALLGHSAGAHLVSMLLVDPSVLEGATVPRDLVQRYGGRFVECLLQLGAAPQTSCPSRHHRHVTAAVCLSGPYSAALMDLRGGQGEAGPLSRAEEEQRSRRLEHHPFFALPACTRLRRLVVRSWYIFPAFGYDER